MTLEKLVREAALFNRLTGLTLWPNPDGWRAGIRRKDGAWKVEIRDDPVEALLAVLAPSLAPPAPPNPQHDTSIFD